MPRAHVRDLSAFLDFEACANAEWDGKPVCRGTYEATRQRLEAAGHGARIHEYLCGLRELEGRRPSTRTADGCFDDVRSYREAVARLSLSAPASIAFGASSVADEIRATFGEANRATLFHIAMQCQVIDDVIDYEDDLSAGLPSFLTVPGPPGRAVALTAAAARGYGAWREHAVERAAFPFRAALALATAAALGAILVVRGGTMARATVRPVAALALVASLAVLSAAPAPTGVARSILVTVLDKAGDPLRDLEPREFIVTEDGTERQILDARPNNEALFVALLVDTANPPPGVQFPTQDVRRALSAFSRRVLNGTAGSQVAVFDLANAGSTVVPFTADLKRVTTWTDRLVQSQQGIGVLLEALVAASQDLARKESPRRAIVSVTFEGPEGSAVTPQSVAETVLKSGAAYWPVTIRTGGGIRPALVPLRETMFANLPGPTGGLHASANSTTALDAILGRVAAALTSQYEVTYSRPDGIPVRVIEASARRGATFLRGSWIR